MSHPFPRNSPGSLRAMPRPGSASDSASIQCVPQTCQSPPLFTRHTSSSGFPRNSCSCPFPRLCQLWFHPADESSLTERMPWAQGHQGGGCGLQMRADMTLPSGAPSPPGVGGVGFAASDQPLPGWLPQGVCSGSFSKCFTMTLSFQSSPTPLAVCFLSLPSSSVVAGFGEVQRVGKLA